MINIKDIYGKIRLSTQINIGAKGKFSLMKEDYIILPFTLSAPVHFRLGDYTDLTGILDESMGGRMSKIYEITDVQKPERNKETGGYDYKLRLDAYYIKWKNKIFKYLPEGRSQEASWSLTANLSVHLEIFLRNLNALRYLYKNTGFQYEIDSTVSTKAISLTYSNTNMLDALTMMAEALECEWWVTDNVIHFGRCEYGTPVRLEIFREVSKMERSESKGVYATRIYAFGSERNIPANYRPSQESVVVNGVVQRRLMLPSDTPYIDVYPNMTESEAIETVVVFDDVFPHMEGHMSNITSYQSTAENQDGTKTERTFYRYKDLALSFDKKYILERQSLKITFSSGLLNGMTFGVVFNPTNEDAHQWEIVQNEDYGRPLPDEVIKPQNGDEYVLSGYDASLISLDMVPNAEQNLLKKTREYAEKAKVDDSTFTVSLYSTWVEQDKIQRSFDVGQRINLINDAYFEKERISRILGWEFNLDIPYDSPIYTVGESPAFSRLGNLEDKIESLTFKGKTYGGGGNGVYVIRTNDDTAPSDFNVYSALRQKNDFLSKKYDDVVQGLITFMKGAKFGEYADGITGYGGHIDGDGNAEFESLSIRRFLEVPELRYNRVNLQIGNKWNAPGEGIIEQCIPDVDADGKVLMTGTIILHLEEGEIGTVAVDDICQGIFHHLKGNSTQDTNDSRGNFEFSGFATCYFRITEILDSAHNSKFRYALRGVSESWKHTFHPTQSMHFVGYGNFTDKSRQTSRYSTRTYERYLKDVSDWQFTSDMIAAQFGDLSNLSVFGFNMEGYSAYLNNIYMSGLIEQFENYPLRIEIDTEGDTTLAYGEHLHVSCTVFKGWDERTSQVTRWEIIRDSGNAADDAAWALRNKVRNFNGIIDICLDKDSSIDDLGKSDISCLFTIKAFIENGIAVTKQLII